MASLACGLGSAAGAQTRIAMPEAEIDAHYAVASEHFGDGQVQMHARRDSEAGSRHTVYSFDCVEQTYEAQFDGDAAPETFPIEPTGTAKEPLTKETVVVPLAQHACEQHGHPLLELRW